MEPVTHKVGRHGKLLAIQTDRFKSEFLKLQLAVPITEGTAQSYALIMDLLRRGTRNYPTKALLLRHLDDLYATTVTPFNRRLGDLQLLGFTSDFLGARFVGGKMGLLPEVIGAMGEMLEHPFMPQGHFHTPYVEAEKRHLRDAIRAKINNPRGYAREKCRALLCKGEPYAASLLGEENTVDALTDLGLTAAWQALLQHASPLFFYVGNNAPADVASLLEERFGDFGGNAVLPQTIVKQHQGEVLRAEEEMPLCQGKLSVGYRTDVSFAHPLACATAVLNEVFGGSPASKLFLNVREKRSLCYYCASSLSLYKGTLFVGSDMKVENREIAENAIRNEFEAILRGDISETELCAAKKSLNHTYLQQADFPAALSSFYLHRALLGNSDTLEGQRARIATVTREDVVQAASRVREGAVFFLRGTLEEEVEEL